MTIALVTAAIKTTLNGLTAVTAEATPKTLTLTAHDPPPPAMPQKFPLCYTLTGAAVDSEDDGSDMDLEARDYEVHCAIGASAQMNPALREHYTRALIPAIKAKLKQYSGFGVAQVIDVKVTGDSGVIVLPEHDQLYDGFIVNLNVSELIARTYATSE